MHSHSYTGNALACRAALATLELFEQNNVITSNRALSAAITHAAQDIAHHPRVSHFRNRGMIWAFDVQSSDPAFARTFHQRALAREVLLRPIGNTVYFMPPYVIDANEIALLIRATLELLPS